VPVTGVRRRPGVICGDRAAGQPPRALPTLLRLPYLAADIGGRATACGRGNGLVAVVVVGAGLGFPRLGPDSGTDREKGPERFRVAAGHRPGVRAAQDCQSVRIYASDQCPRQDSNLRARLRRPVLFMAATWQNARRRPPWGAYGGRSGRLGRRGGSLVFPGDCQHGPGGRQAGGSMLMV
jgi:hypothetical protein